MAFADLKKKKKKPVIEEQADEDTMAVFADLKKKKKKKPVPEAEPEQEENVDDVFAGLKKKKKQPKEEQEEEDDEPVAELNLVDDVEGVVFNDAPENDQEDGQASESWVGTNRDYSYGELLSRVFKILRQNNPELQGEKRKYTIQPPQVVREGTKKTAFVNIVDICKHMRREPEHLIQYLFAELGTSGSIDGNQRLVIKGRFQQKQIEIVLKRYIVEYVTCKTCKSPQTRLTKNNRIFFLECESCGSSRSVSTIKAGFMAQTGKRQKPQPVN
ncbi:domain found in IF2B/IF5-domain-containing protein [Gorgonomyces haynaldii]|nr:domain found in IF2B/IF5-domain-containing protein [Gorgonomyces haynaldii]